VQAQWVGARLPGVYSQEFQNPKSFAGVDLDAALTGQRPSYTARSTGVLIPSQWPVARSFRNKLMCLQPRFCSLPLDAFRIGACAGRCFLGPIREPKMKGIRTLFLGPRKTFWARRWLPCCIRGGQFGTRGW